MYKSIEKFNSYFLGSKKFPAISYTSTNAAARMIFSTSRYDHITPFLRQLHWLKARERKIGDYADCVLQSRAPDLLQCTAQTTWNQGPILAELHTEDKQWKTWTVLYERVASDRTGLTETTLTHTV